MSRVQLALNVSNIDAAVDFYSKLFGTEPVKRQPGYANFSIEQPPLKLVLIENAQTGEPSNHFGIEVVSAEEVSAAIARLKQVGLATSPVQEITCCHAKQNKFWAQAPDGEAWEIYTVLEDVDTFSPPPESRPEPSKNNASVCCA